MGCVHECVCVVMKLPVTSCPQLWPSELSKLFPCRGLFKLNAKFDANSLLYLFSHFVCGGHTVHMLTQRCLLPPLTNAVNGRCSCMCVPVHSPWLPGYISVMLTILIILTMAGLFPDRPCMLVAQHVVVTIPMTFNNVP